MHDFMSVERAALALEGNARALVNALHMHAPEAEEIRPVWARLQDAYNKYIQELEEFEQYESGQ